MKKISALPVIALFSWACHSFATPQANIVYAHTPVLYPSGVSDQGDMAGSRPTQGGASNAIRVSINQIEEDLTVISDDTDASTMNAAGDVGLRIEMDGRNYPALWKKGSSRLVNLTKGTGLTPDYMLPRAVNESREVLVNEENGYQRAYVFNTQLGTYKKLKVTDNADEAISGVGLTNSGVAIVNLKSGDGGVYRITVKNGPDNGAVEKVSGLAANAVATTANERGDIAGNFGRKGGAWFLPAGASTPIALEQFDCASIVEDACSAYRPTAISENGFIVGYGATYGHGEVLILWTLDGKAVALDSITSGGEYSTHDNGRFVTARKQYVAVSARNASGTPVTLLLTVKK